MRTVLHMSIHEQSVFKQQYQARSLSKCELSVTSCDVLEARLEVNE